MFHIPDSFSLLLAMLLLTPSIAGAVFNPWDSVRTKAPGPVKIIGSYSSGCFQGAVSVLPTNGKFELMRPLRRRYFSHPNLREFIHWLGNAVQENGYGKLLVGDLSQVRGGPTTTGHASHQNGLDVDIWFWLNSPAVSRTLSAQERTHLSAPSMLNAAQNGVDFAKFGAAHIGMLELAASYPQVERIFINPHIKKVLCERTGEAGWLYKLRPWFGHDDHIHVRLQCPPGQTDCIPQEPPTRSPECGIELNSWLVPKTHKTEGPKLTLAQRLKAKLELLPSACEAVLNSGR